MRETQLTRKDRFEDSNQRLTLFGQNLLGIIQCPMLGLLALTQKSHNLLYSIEDASFLIQRLLKVAVKGVRKAMAETIDVFRKLKMVKEFRRRINQLEKDIKSESMKLVEQADMLAQEFSQGRCAIKLA